MKNNLLLIVALLISAATFGQGDFSRGFQNGYKKGYCHNDFGCIDPIPPITPIPMIGESYDSYMDGYNRGFKMGLEDKAAKSNSKGAYQGGGNSGSGGYRPAEYQYQSPNYDLLLKALEMKQAREERNEQMQKEKAIGMMSQVKSYYNSLNTFPEKIKDGWHKVISMNNYDFCEERKVYVENNKVTKYVIDDWMNKTISYPPVIYKGKAMAQLLEDNGSNGNMVELYFLEDMNNPNSYTSPPVGSGKISFWTSWKNSGNMRLFFDGMYIGKFTSYFSDGEPACGQDGTLTIEYKPGTYNFRATSTGGWSDKTWEGTVTIYSGGCQLQGLRK